MLEKVQKRTTRMISACSKLLYSDRLKYSHIKTWEIQRRWLKHLKFYMTSMTVVSPTLPHCDFMAIRGNNFKLVKHYCKYDIRKYFLLRELWEAVLRWGRGHVPPHWKASWPFWRFLRSQNAPKSKFYPGWGLRSRWGSLQRSPELPIWWEGARCMPSSQEPHPAFGPSGLVSAGLRV